MKKEPKVAKIRNYRVQTVKEAKEIASAWLEKIELKNVVSFGLPEIDDRYHVWRVPLKKKNTSTQIGEIVIDARTSLIQHEKTTKKEIL